MALIPLFVAGGVGVYLDTAAPNGLVIQNSNTSTRIGSANTLPVLPITDKSGGGAIGTAAATVDQYSSFDVNQTTAAQTLSIPSPTDATSGREVVVSNVGSQSFTITAAIAAGASARFKWTGAAWSRLA